MAFNFSVFRVRALSALVFVIIMLGGLVWNNYSFFLLFIVIAMGCLFEYQKLIALVYPNYTNISLIHKWGMYLLAGGIMFTLSSKILPFNGQIFKLMGTIVVPILLVIMVVGDVVSKRISLQNWAITIAGLVYIPMGLSLFYQIKNIPVSGYNKNMDFVIPLLIMVAVWINDTMAYLIGSIIGKTQISAVSPNKTWEGTIGGIIVSILIVTKTTNYLLPILHINIVFLICLISTIAGNFGDFFESKLKRFAGVKDSGSMMPGHGGFLDRFDSILLAGPFVWILLDIMYHQ
jgi:phosphatidate cytidylyltransferase